MHRYDSSEKSVRGQGMDLKKGYFAHRRPARRDTPGGYVAGSDLHLKGTGLQDQRGHSGQILDIGDLDN